MATVNNTFLVLPVIIPASDLPDVTVARDGIVRRPAVEVSDSATAHEMALWWLAAERGIRAAAADRAQAARLRARAEAEEAAVTAEAKELRLAFYDDACMNWDNLASVDKAAWTRAARESLERHGKLGSDA